MPPAKQPSGEHVITSQELQLIELKRWLEAEFRDVKSDMKEDREVLRDVHDRVTRREVKQEFQEKGFSHRRVKTESTTNPLNKSMGVFLGDVLVTALKIVAVASTSALMLVGYDLTKKEKLQPQPPAYPAPSPSVQPASQKGQQP